jgi:hypothetical protein
VGAMIEKPGKQTTSFIPLNSNIWWLCAVVFRLTKTDPFSHDHYSIQFKQLITAPEMNQMEIPCVKYDGA